MLSIAKRPLSRPRTRRRHELAHKAAPSNVSSLGGAASLEGEPRLEAHRPWVIGLVGDLPEGVHVSGTRLFSEILRRPEDIGISKLHGIEGVVSRRAHLNIPLPTELEMLRERKIDVVFPVGADPRQHSS